MMGRISIAFLGVIAAVNALPYSSPNPHVKVKRQVDELRDSYDFVVIGGGTAGLTVADRLTEAFPNRTTLVIEYGVVEKAIGSFDPPDSGPGASRLGISSLPIPALKGTRASLVLGMTVGGSSAVNGQFFDRGSKHDYNDWSAIGSPEFDDSGDKWNWEGIFPYFKKSVLFHEPPKEQVEEYGYTWDMSAFGGTTPIHSSFAAFQFPIQQTIRDAFREMGVPISKECSGGDKVGVCWVPTSQDPMTAERSHAGIGHYADVIDKRDNYDLLVAHKALRVIPAKDGGPPTVEFRSRDDKNAQVKRVTPKLEVVLSAGAIHTPQILQRSGIGAKAFLKKAGIDVVVDLPGVGYNFQDHCGPRFSFSLAQSFFPNQGSLTSNATFRQEAMEQYKKRPAQGPYTLAMGNSAIYIPLRNVTDHYMDIIHLITEQVESGTALDYLPSDVPDEVKKGYLAQLTLLAKSHAHPEQAILEAPWMSSAPGGGFLLKPLSRGTVMLNPEDHDAEPIVDYRTASNPVDLHVMASFLEFLRRYYATPTMKALGAVEQQPGAGVTKIEDIIESFRGGVTPSFMHPCCTAAMMPKEKGGVVGPDLKVHGVDGLRVVDLSIVPLIPGTHTSATTYAIGEKAAGMIIRKWSGGKM